MKKIAMTVAALAAVVIPLLAVTGTADAAPAKHHHNQTWHPGPGSHDTKPHDGHKGSIVTDTVERRYPRKHKVVFKAGGDIPAAMVEVDGKTSIEQYQYLPYRTTQRLSGFDYDWASVSVEDMDGYENVWCEIWVDGRLKSSDYSDFGLAYCTL